MENSKTTIGKTKVSALLPVMLLVASEWGLNLTKTHDWNVCRRIVENSIQNN